MLENTARKRTVEDLMLCSWPAKVPSGTRGQLLHVFAGHQPIDCSLLVPPVPLLQPTGNQPGTSREPTRNRLGEAGPVPGWLVPGWLPIGPGLVRGLFWQGPESLNNVQLTSRWPVSRRVPNHHLDSATSAPGCYGMWRNTGSKLFFMHSNTDD